MEHIKIVEKHIRYFPEHWDAYDVRNYLMQYGTVLRVNINKNKTATAIFDSRHLDPILTESKDFRNPQNGIVITYREGSPFYQKEQIPHAFASEVTVGFAYNDGIQTYFVPKSSIDGITVCKIWPKKKRFGFQFNKDGNEYLMTWHVNQVFEWKFKDVDAGDHYKLYLRGSKPPKIFRKETKDRKIADYWTIDMLEPNWKRTTNIFPEFTDFLLFEFKRFAMKIKIPKNKIWDLITYILSQQPKEIFKHAPSFPDDKFMEPFITFEEFNTLRLHFKNKFLLYSVISLGYTTIFDLNRDFLERIAGWDESRLFYALFKILGEQERMCPRSIKYFTQRLAGLYERLENVPIKSIEAYDDLIGRVVVTPTMFYVIGGEYGQLNRITRDFHINRDNFLRLSFVEENWDKLYVDSRDMKLRIKRFLKCFPLLGKNFEILGYSKSQLKNQITWMLCPEEISANEIRSQLGDFSKIRIPGKYTTRVGQCFASSTYVITLTKDQIEEIADIEHHDYNFSDGIGKISPELAKEINLVADKDSTAFQFRMGGYKGVVAIDDRLKGKILQLRPSVKKFQSNHLEFELLNTAEYRHGHLNKQLIMLLSTLGVPDMAFIELLEEAFRSIDNNCKEYILDVSKTKNFKRIKAVQCLEKVMDYPDEPVVCIIRNTLKQNVMYDLKKKQRIWVNHSGILMGALDEKGELEYGEVFIQIIGEGNNFILEGPVVVGKNPCLHPGDIRVLNAVNKPSLHHLKNVIVFPQNGPRPHQNECSGSDLDGDLYFVSWEPRLIPPRIIDPMTYDSDTPKIKHRKFNHYTLIKFFVKYAAYEVLGRIDTFHLALADKSDKFALDKKCIELCKLHATAVDFANNGIVVEIPEIYRPGTYPDHMEQDEDRTYKSEKILGILYRNISQQLERVPEINQDNIFPYENEHKDKALALLKEYKETVNSTIKKYNLKSEIEFLIGQRLASSRPIFDMPGMSAREFGEMLIETSNKLVESLRQKFEEDPSLELASACYNLPETQEYKAFPWIVCGAEILEIKKIQSSYLKS